MSEHEERQNDSVSTTKGKRCSVDIPGLGLVDGRTREARLYGQTVTDVSNDLGGDGQLSRAQIELVRRAAGLAVLATVAEARLLNGDDIDINELISLGNAQRRILATLGLERKAKPVPSLQEHLEKRRAEKAQGSEEARQ